MPGRGVVVHTMVRHLVDTIKYQPCQPRVASIYNVKSHYFIPSTVILHPSDEPLKILRPHRFRSSTRVSMILSLPGHGGANVVQGIGSERIELRTHINERHLIC